MSDELKVNAYATAPPTPTMATYGLSFYDVVEYAKYAIKWLQEEGDNVVGVLEATFKAWSAVTSRDLTGVLAAFAKGKGHVEEIIDSIRREFGL
jgi:hypothetical protein